MGWGVPYRRVPIADQLCRSLVQLFFHGGAQSRQQTPDVVHLHKYLLIRRCARGEGGRGGRGGGGGPFVNKKLASVLIGLVFVLVFL